MESLFAELSTEICEILKGHNKTLHMYDENGSETFDPSVATRIFFMPNRVMLSMRKKTLKEDPKLIMNIMNSQKVIKNLMPLIEIFRNLCVNYNILFLIRKHNVAVLNPKDFKHELVKENKIYSNNLNKINNLLYYELGLINGLDYCSNNYNILLSEQHIKTVHNFLIESNIKYSTNTVPKINNISIEIAIENVKATFNDKDLRLFIKSNYFPIAKVNMYVSKKSVVNALKKYLTEKIKEKYNLNIDENSIELLNSAAIYLFNSYVMHELMFRKYNFKNTINDIAVDKSDSGDVSDNIIFDTETNNIKNNGESNTGSFSPLGSGNIKRLW